MLLGRWAILVMLASVPLASASPALRSPSPQTPIDVMRVMLAGQLAAEAGDLARALTLFDQAEKDAPSAETAFNRAVLLELERPRGWANTARSAYAAYLTRLPRARDRVAIAAKQEALKACVVQPACHLTQWVGLGSPTRSPDMITAVPIDEPAGIILSNGEVVGPAPAEIDVDTRDIVEWISATTYARQQLNQMQFWPVRISAQVNPGNVLVSIDGRPDPFSWTDAGGAWSANQRIQRPLGRQQTLLPGACNGTLSFEVRANALTYVHVRTSPRKAGATCTQISVDVRYLKLPGRAS